MHTRMTKRTIDSVDNFQKNWNVKRTTSLLDARSEAIELEIVLFNVVYCAQMDTPARHVVD